MTMTNPFKDKLDKLREAGANFCRTCQETLPPIPQGTNQYYCDKDCRLARNRSNRDGLIKRLRRTGQAAKASKFLDLG